ncbi:hypothetical protein NA57DRAFT_78763 [Rhizodiscina lignyota]|uniref:Uncharacterized protein n=1 Tax=Rhizodiscina lignyota TaxID=1504668 RepID=A0A9P4I6D2_9PEZI|nr:hypothetical protein NA57DRAFT_78763 [Rhizodiscina lignyota]
MAQQTNSVYVNGDFSEPMSNQHNFDREYSLDNPKRAMCDYSRIMHRHTKQQLDLATSSARRRSQGNSIHSLSPTESNGLGDESINSTDS